MKRPRKAPGVGRTVAIIASIFLFVGTGVAVYSSAAETAAVADSISLSPYARTASPVTFIHKAHGSTGESTPSCSDCHHTTAWDQVPEKCSACHMPLDDSAAPTDTVAFHKLCIGCHKTEIGLGNKRLSLACDSCHLPNGTQ